MTTEAQVVECYICGKPERFLIRDPAFRVTSQICRDCARAVGPEWINERVQEAPPDTGREREHGD